MTTQENSFLHIYLGPGRTQKDRERKNNKEGPVSKGKLFKQLLQH